MLNFFIMFHWVLFIRGFRCLFIYYCTSVVAYVIFATPLCDTIVVRAFRGFLKLINKTQFHFNHMLLITTQLSTNEVNSTLCSVRSLLYMLHIFRTWRRKMHRNFIWLWSLVDHKVHLWSSWLYKIDVFTIITGGISIQLNMLLYSLFDKSTIKACNILRAVKRRLPGQSHQVQTCIVYI